MPISPEQYGQTGPYELLSAAALGHIAFDRRLIAALMRDPAQTQPALIRFSGEDRSEDRVDISFDLLYLFACMPTPEALPFLVGEMRRSPDDASPELIDLANRLGPPAAEALLDLFEETGRTHAEMVFVAFTAGATGPRAEEAVAAIEAIDSEDADFLREVASTPYEQVTDPPEFDYPPEADPDLTVLPESEREEFLQSESPGFRLMAATSYIGEELTDRRRQQFLAMGASDPDARVRGTAWEALREDIEQTPVYNAMVARLAEASDPYERACLGNSLAAFQPDLPQVIETIEEAYLNDATRAKSLEAMWRSLDRRWSAFPVKHLEDRDVEVRRQAILAVGYFQLRGEARRLEAALKDGRLREDAIYAYALAAPAEETKFGLRQLEKRLETLAGGFGEDEQAALEFAFDMRLQMAGRAPRAGSDATAASAPAAAKAGRNDPCPCGSGKKFKKCCGA